MTPTDMDAAGAQASLRLLERLMQCGEQYGLPQVAVADLHADASLDPANRYIATSFSPPFVKALQAISNAENCQLVVRAGSSSAPWGWDAEALADLIVESDGPQLGAEFLSLLQGADIEGGYCIPVYAPFHTALLITFCGAHRCAGIAYPDLVLAAIEAVDAFKIDIRSQVRSFSQLTHRELECLSWVAQGKTSSELAEIIGLSEHTVNHYLLAATKKLDSVNRTQAVGKAIRYGLI